MYKLDTYNLLTLAHEVSFVWDFLEMKYSYSFT